MGVFGLSVLVVVIVAGSTACSARWWAACSSVWSATAGSYLGGEYKPWPPSSLVYILALVRPYGLFSTQKSRDYKHPAPLRLPPQGTLPPLAQQSQFHA